MVLQCSVLLLVYAVAEQIVDVIKKPNLTVCLELRHPCKARYISLIKCSAKGNPIEVSCSKKSIHSSVCKSWLVIAGVPH